MPNIKHNSAQNTSNLSSIFFRSISGFYNLSALLSGKCLQRKWEIRKSEGCRSYWLVQLTWKWCSWVGTHSNWIYPITLSNFMFDRAPEQHGLHSLYQKWGRVLRGGVHPGDDGRWRELDSQRVPDGRGCRRIQGARRRVSAQVWRVWLQGGLHSNSQGAPSGSEALKKQ